MAVVESNRFRSYKAAKLLLEQRNGFLFTYRSHSSLDDCVMSVVTREFHLLLCWSLEYYFDNRAQVQHPFRHQTSTQQFSIEVRYVLPV